MKVPRHADSLLIVWRVAELEARNLGSGRLGPAHFFLGLLKIVDIDIDSLLERLAGIDPTRGSDVRADLRRLQDVFEDAGIRTTQLRRRLRLQIRDGTGAGTSGEGRLRRDSASRAAFVLAADISTTGDNMVRPIHLLLALLQQGPDGIEVLLEGSGVPVGELRRIVATHLSQEGIQRSSRPEPRGRGRRSPKGAKDVDANLLESLGRDLNALARESKLSPIIGRQEEMRRLAQIMAQSRKNNVILIGDAGVGKTGIVEGLAQRIVKGDVIEDFRSVRIVELSVAALVAGTTFRGDFEARLQAVLKQAAADPNLILFIDEIHLIMGAGQGANSAMDAANILKPALARGEVRVIGATTTAEYRRHIEKDSAIERRFQVIEVGEPSDAETLEILKGVCVQIEKHHKVQVEEEALQAAIELSVRFLPDLRLPDKAIDLIDQACAQSRMASLSPREFAGAREGIRVDRKAIAAVVAKRCRVPVENVGEPEGKRLLELEERLRVRVKGQDHALRVVSEAIRLSRSGLGDRQKPVGVFLLVGATGSGKTELAKALTEVLFGDERRMTRLDMSEFMEEHTASRLIGSPPGFVGYDEGGQLTEKVRSNPHGAVLLDEIEKAHPKILDLFLQVFDEGILTDSRGRRCSFRDCVIIMTSNIGSDIREGGRRLGFRDDDDRDGAGQYEAAVIQAVRGRLRPELFNRITGVVVFSPLSNAAIREIVQRQIMVLNGRLKEQGVELEVDGPACELLMKAGFSSEYGAREMARTVEGKLAKPLAEELLRGTIKAGDLVRVRADVEELVFDRPGPQ